MAFNIPQLNNPLTVPLATYISTAADTPTATVVSTTEEITKEDVETKGPTLYLADANPEARTMPKPFYMACYWHITPGTDGNEIEASNNVTGDRYEGSIADFNDMLKGL